MKQRGWLMIGGAVALMVMSLQGVAGNESQGHYGSWSSAGYGGGAMGMPGYSGHGGYGRHGAQQGMGHGYERLGLDDKQRSAIRQLIRDSRSKFRKLKNSLTDIRHALYDLMEDNKAAKEADVLADSMGDLMAERIKLRIGLRLKINQLLTQEQREQARDMQFFGRGFGG